MPNLASHVIPSTGGYEIDQSLRFNDDDTAYLNKTFASAGNRKTWTWSGWVKRGNLGTDQGLFAAGATGTDWFVIGFRSTDFLHITQNVSGSYPIDIRTPALYRDNSSWYHVLIQVDTTQATSSDRVKLYVNGVQLTSLMNYSGGSPVYPSQNFDTRINSTVVNTVGSAYNGSPMWLCDGYLADVHFIDGQALDASYFGETDADYGHWKPIKYTGTYGTNGFYLDFSNSSSLGEDQSGNSNDWTANNLAATDVVLDSPTNNFATLNPLDLYNSPTLSNGNLDVPVPTSANRFVGSTFRINQGKWYFEYVNRRATTSANNSIGWTPGNAKSAQDETYGYAGFILYTVSVTMGETATNALVRVGTGSGGITVAQDLGWKYDENDVVNVAIDFDNKKIWFGKNGTWYGSGDPAAGTSPTTTINSAVTSMQPFDVAYYRGVWNFGQDSSFAGNKTAQGNTDANGIGDFYYAPPSGYLALCTQNLPAPTVAPADHFNTVLYTGNSSTQSITGVGFQPDFTWIKRRNAANNNILFDAVRTAGYELSSNLTNAEAANYPNFTSFDSDGFSLNSTSNTYNNSTGIYVAWNWKANGSGVSNTDGTITSTVSANQDAGFSIVSYTGINATATVGHGLSSAPELMIVKNRDNSGVNWVTYDAVNGKDGFLSLNQTNAFASYSNYWGASSPTSSVFSLSSGYTGNNTSGEAYIAYCFHSVDSYSKIGVYTGNGSTDGPFVYTGFRPAFVMIKTINLAGGHWAMHDSTRDPYNVSQKWLFASSNSAEQTTTYSQIDFVSNGFKIRSAGSDNVNYSGYSHLFIAFAETPFKYSNGR